ARPPARTGVERRPSRRISFEWDRIQPCACRGTGASRRCDRGSWCGNGVHRERIFVLRRPCGCPEMEKTGSQPDCTAGVLGGATVAAIRYVRNSPAIVTVLVRTGIVLFFSSSLFALLPLVAKGVNKSAIGYGVLLGCIGFGGIGGALIMQTLRSSF